jgi:hypothetical protein
MTELLVLLCHVLEAVGYLGIVAAFVLLVTTQ